MVSLRIPYTGPLPVPHIIPKTEASTLRGTINALIKFLAVSGKTVLLTGAGISVASGLNDYRGPSGTYRINKSYRPTYFSEFVSSHESRKRYWARSFLGWPSTAASQPSNAHIAVNSLATRGVFSHIITQNVDSLHSKAAAAVAQGLNPVPLTELHGTLSHARCLTCSLLYPRLLFQQFAASLNPSWASFLAKLQTSGAFATQNPQEQATRGLRTNPDGDVDVPGLTYADFAYPACPVCLKEKGSSSVHADARGAWIGGKAGVLKPGVVMFGETVEASSREQAERAVREADKLLVVGSSLATYSAWRLVRQMHDQGGRIAVINLGGVRGEKELVDLGCIDVRSALDLQAVLPMLAEELCT